MRNFVLGFAVCYALTAALTANILSATGFYPMRAIVQFSAGWPSTALALADIIRLAEREESPKFNVR